MFKRETLIGTGLGLLVGALVGYAIGHRGTEPPAQTAVAAPPAPLTGGQSPIFEGLAAPGAAVGVVPPPAPSAVLVPDPAILFAAEHATTQNPKDPKAWINLGNAYFDSHQHQKSVDAYAKALALDPKNPDVLTDQGVMYKELHAFEKAVACFEKAQKLDPTHIQSLFNLGVVYSHDLKAPAKAEKAWARLVEMAPGSPQAAQARAGLEQLKKK